MTEGGKFINFNINLSHVEKNKIIRHVDTDVMKDYQNGYKIFQWENERIALDKKFYRE